MKLCYAVGLFVLTLSSCYCKKQVRGYSSVRELKVARTYYICPEPEQLSKGKTFLFSAYGGDPIHQQLKFSKSYTTVVTSDISYSDFKIFGGSMERYLKLGAYPGPLLGVGIDYLHSSLQGKYHTVMNQTDQWQTQTAVLNRCSFNFKLVTWITDRMMGYFLYQPGWDFLQQKIVSDAPYYNSQLKLKPDFSQRVGYGFHFYFRPGMALNTELGYGGGTFLKVGFSFWVF